MRAVKQVVFRFRRAVRRNRKAQRKNVKRVEYLNRDPNFARKIPIDRKMLFAFILQVYIYSRIWALLGRLEVVVVTVVAFVALLRYGREVRGL